VSYEEEEEDTCRSTPSRWWSGWQSCWCLPCSSPRNALGTHIRNTLGTHYVGKVAHVCPVADVCQVLEWMFSLENEYVLYRMCSLLKKTQLMSA
jgi:hypothetical protein